jgi:hypothetical protein
VHDDIGIAVFATKAKAYQPDGQSLQRALIFAASLWYWPAEQTVQLCIVLINFLPISQGLQLAPGLLICLSWNLPAAHNAQLVFDEVNDLPLGQK